MPGSRKANADPRVLVEQVQALAETQALSLAINTLLAVSVATILWRDSPDRRLFAWLPMAIAPNLFRWILLCSPWWRRRLATMPATALRISVLGSVWSGVMWGCVPLILLNANSTASMFVSIILCGLTAGAAVQGGAYALPVVAISIPILLPLMAYFARLGTLNGEFLAFDILLYLGMIVRSSRGAESNFSKLADLRWQAAMLANDLQQQNEASLASAEKFYRLANHDPLTGVHNRAAFTLELERRLRGHGGEDSGVDGREDGDLLLLLVDLDHFKAVNDTLGHGAGDEVLQAVAERLHAIADDRCFVARLGGDEFAILAAGRFDAGRFDAGRLDDGWSAAFADRLIDDISAPLVVRGEPLDVGCSLGLASYPADAANAEELLARADLALYAAKYGGRRTWRRFEPQMLSAAEFAREIERDLPSAIAARAVEVWFQPQVDILSGRLIGLEALLRWTHPTLGKVSPPDIVAAALKLRQTQLLTRYVLESSFDIMADLDVAGLDHVRIGVNISPRELAHYDLGALVRDMLAARHVPPARLELEITEEAVLTDERAIETFFALQKQGVRIAIDDFGTGNSSIAYLRKLRLDRIKIDRSFVTEIATSHGDRALVQAIVSMGRSLGIEVLAEGVETTDEALILSSLGCRLAQGFLFGAALSRVELRDRFAAAGADATPWSEPAIRSGIQRRVYTGKKRLD